MKGLGYKMDYSDLGRFTEALMKSYIKGEIDEKEFVKFIDTRIEQMKDEKIVLFVEGKKQHELFLELMKQNDVKE